MSAMAWLRGSSARGAGAGLVREAISTEHGGMPAACPSGEGSSRLQ
jgi:hypothetical protein